MIRVSAAEFQRNIGKYQDIALREPVAVTRNGRGGTVLISAEDYRELRRNYRRVMRLEDFTEEDIRAIENARPSAESAAYDHEMESWSVTPARPVPGQVIRYSHGQTNIVAAGKMA